MDAVDPAIIDQLEQYASEVAGVETVTGIRARWVGHQLQAEIGIRVEPDFTAEQIATVSVDLADDAVVALPDRTSGAVSILPPKYQDPGVSVSAAPMGSAALQYDDHGEVAWDEMWTGFCELALAGGAPHRGTLLEPVHEAAIAANPEQYTRVVGEIERGLAQVTGLPTVRSTVAGWVGLACTDEAMAIWLLRAIVVENVTVRREDQVLWFPAGPDFRLEREIKNVITVVAKTVHYWQDHIAGTVSSSR